MNIVRGFGIKISRSGSAQQLVILCHGGWKPLVRQAGCLRRQSGDAASVAVPGTSRLFFYTEDGMSETGWTVFKEIMARPQEAFRGLEKRGGITQEEAELLDRDLLPGDLPCDLEVKESFASGDPEDRDPKDYALYYHSLADAKFSEHQQGKYDAGVDLATVEDTKHKRHLSDVFALTANLGYTVYHFAACRVRR